VSAAAIIMVETFYHFAKRMPVFFSKVSAD
jgi:hypothetical protein